MPQNYRYAEYPFLGLVFGVIEGPDGQVVTTTMALAAAIGVEPRTLRMNHENNTHMFNPLRGNSIGAKEIIQLIQQHRERFMIRRMRDDLLLWTEEDMYMHCHFSRSERAAQFMRHNVRFLREWRMANVRPSPFSEERFAQIEATCKEMQKRLDDLTAHPPIDGTASVRFTLN
jgi:hypothetical protein